MFREKGLPEVVDLLCDAMCARIELLEEEKTGLSNSVLEKIPECPVNAKFYLESTRNVFFARFVLRSIRGTNPFSAAWQDTISVDPVGPIRPSR